MCNVVALHPRQTELEIARQQIDHLQKTISRYQMAYLGLVTTHAILMMDTMTQEGIREALDGDYDYSVTRDCIEDLRGALNGEREDRLRLERRFKQTWT